MPRGNHTGDLCCSLSILRFELQDRLKPLLVVKAIAIQIITNASEILVRNRRSRNLGMTKAISMRLMMVACQTSVLSSFNVTTGNKAVVRGMEPTSMYSAL